MSKKSGKRKHKKFEIGEIVKYVNPQKGTLYRRDDKGYLQAYYDIDVKEYKNLFGVVEETKQGKINMSLIGFAQAVIVDSKKAFVRPKRKPRISAWWEERSPTSDMPRNVEYV